MPEQILVYTVIGGTLALLIWGRFRYDMVALIAVTVLTLAGLLEPADIFAGFGNDAVLSVIAIMVVGRAVRISGATEPFAVFLLRSGGKLTGQTLAINSTAAFFSAFMNNTGALTVFLPVTVHVARVAHRLASSLLIPLAYSTLLGGMVTLIGTPPNILVSSFRKSHLGEPFSLFDYTPVGLGIAVAGITFLSVIGWRLLPPRRGSLSTERSLRIQQYFAEVLVTAQSTLTGKTLRDLGAYDLDVNVVGLVRGSQRIAAPLATEPVVEGDVLLVEADAEQLGRLVEQTGVQLGENRVIAEEEIGSSEVLLEKLVVPSVSPLVGRTAQGLRMRWRYGMNVLAVSREGARIVRRISQVRFRAGDVLFVQVREDGLDELLQQLHLYTLEDHEHVKPSMPKLLGTLAIFLCAMTGVVTGSAPLGIAFLAAALALVVVGIVSVKEAYSAVDWSVVILLGATIPLGTALERSGGADTIAQALIQLSQGLHPSVMLGALMVVTMLLSNVMNNAATAVLMAPIAFRLGIDMGVSADPFLMGVAVSASACFLTPIGHQCNILVLGPGGYRFSDYARVGLPLSIVVLGVALPLIPYFWPF